MSTNATAQDTESGVTTGQDNGLTCFIRCARCHTFYVPAQGLQWRTGKRSVYWVKPHPIRKPDPCTHAGAVEVWNGSQWVEEKVQG